MYQHQDNNEIFDSLYVKGTAYIITSQFYFLVGNYSSMINIIDWNLGTLKILTGSIFDENNYLLASTDYHLLFFDTSNIVWKLQLSTIPLLDDGF